MIAIVERTLFKPSRLLYRCAHNQYLITNEANGTREITLNHEKTKNSLGLDMMSHLTEAINSNKDDASLRAIVLSAKGNVFSAGHNLKELVCLLLRYYQGSDRQYLYFAKYYRHFFTHKDIHLKNVLADYITTVASTYTYSQLMQSSAGVNQHKLVFQKATELMKSIVQSPVPVIAKVNGFATAAGCQLVATCDMVVCSETSKFSTPGANFGIFCSTPGIAVGRCVPKSRAMYMLFTGLPMTAQEAYESGLVTKVVPASQLDEEVNKIVESWLRASNTRAGASSP